MLLFRIKQAEVALADGRLDEAMKICLDPAVRSHRAGQALVTALLGAYLDRGKQHLLADRLAEAAADANRAEQLDAGNTALAELRSAINAAEVTRRRQDRQAFVTASLEKAKAAIRLGDHDAAVSVLARAGEPGRPIVSGDGAFDASDPGVRETSSELARSLREQIRSSLEVGRLDVARSCLDRLVRIDGTNVETQHLEAFVRQAVLAWEHLRDGRFGEAAEAVHRLEIMFPAAAWLKEVTAQIVAARSAVEQIRGGPLGLVALSPGHTPGILSTVPPQIRPVKTGEVQFPRGPVRSGRDFRAQDAAGTSDRFILKVDGVGSYLVVTRASVTLGPISSSKPPDVGLVIEPSAGVIRIDRLDDDYFIRSDASVLVNDKPTRSKLLTTNDRIALSPRCRVNFVLPHPSSTSAVIHLSGVRYPRGDVRRVILLDRDLIVGPGPASHVRVDSMPAPIVLNCRSERMHCGTDVSVVCDGRALGRADGLPVGRHVRVGDLGIVIESV